MDAIELMKDLGEIGCRYRACDIGPAILYFTNMIADGRVLSVKKDGVPTMVITFSVTDDFEPFRVKGFWDYLPHDPNGKTIYFEKLFSKGWDKEARKMIKEIIVGLYPNLEGAVWHRDVSWGDRKVIVKRREQPCMK